jgi:hypothetical protein
MCGALIGDMIGATLCCMTGAVATSTTLTVAAIVWVFARPMLGTLPTSAILMPADAWNSNALLTPRVAAGIPLFLFGAGIMVGAAVTRGKQSPKPINEGFMRAPEL